MWKEDHFFKGTGGGVQREGRRDRKWKERSKVRSIVLESWGQGRREEGFGSNRTGEMEQ